MVVTEHATARRAMAYLGLTPREYSTGSKRRTGGITKAGNGAVRRLLTESPGLIVFHRAKRYICNVSAFPIEIDFDRARSQQEISKEDHYVAFE